MEPLMKAVLKSLKPETIETVFFDDRNELIDYNIKTDLVVISVETYTAKRSYEIAKKYNLKFIFGVEAYWVLDRLEKDDTKEFGEKQP